jgi:hypothetical protein
MSKQQTAVEWLQNELWSNYEFKSSKQKREFISKIEQAKAMEKEQIIEAHQVSQIFSMMTSEQYYNEIYGGDK